MRIWDIDPGYLNRGSLLGEHRELHGMLNIISMNKKGYSKHPETLRWVKFYESLKIRHELLVEEMTLRGYNHNSPIENISDFYAEFPDTYIDLPVKQISILKEKYRDKEKGRIKLPDNIYSLWANHKYSVMARSPEKAKHIGKKVAKGEISSDELAVILVNYLRIRPQMNRIRNVLEHMWGYVSVKDFDIQNSSNMELLIKIRELVLKNKTEYLIQSTALSELGYWIKSFTDYE